ARLPDFIFQRFPKHICHRWTPSWENGVTLQVVIVDQVYRFSDVLNSDHQSGRAYPHVWEYMAAYECEETMRWTPVLQGGNTPDRLRQRAAQRIEHDTGKTIGPGDDRRKGGALQPEFAVYRHLRTRNPWIDGAYLPKRLQIHRYMN